MTDRFATTPFGGRSLSHAMFAVQEKTARAREKLANTDRNRPEKWALLRSLTEARGAFVLSDRTIAVLEALLSFYPETQLDGATPLIVFPSNTELSMRTRGMSPATIRRHLASLVETGFIIRRDSPNGKRYARRGETGEIEHAFGFDLSPLALRSDEIEAHAVEARDLARAIQRVRSEITIHLRDISKTIDSGVNEERPGDWDIYADELAALSGRVSRHLPLATLQSRCDGLARLRADVERAYLASLTDKEMSASDSSFEHHIQNSNTDHHFERAQENGQKPTAAGTTENALPGSRVAMTRMRKRLEDARRTRGQGAAGSSDVWPGRETKPAPMPLEAVLNACPQIRDYARNGIGDWHDFVQTAGLVRSMLGVSPDAWERARETMGEINASITIAAILERVDEIRSPGGYLRALTDRAEIGQYSVLPVIKALRGEGHA
ncbi:transcriptional regulator [Phyllobacterium brassicacearum]|uniref:Transcriptional regulator n=1 Tax=Phyllobacterium brassicacearum TaxID=314235 RepID=A0A2P7BGP0_9HYPH|nr:plasmid replication protein RepC [Phyllobacterium brassicacearum]PSH65599.1 transcriptional regulator [Phyllobacterium brassicacearum]TDQ20842.1 replication initiation protein RepC [Phyllobacterium brassicacearum]